MGSAVSPISAAPKKYKKKKYRNGVKLKPCLACGRWSNKQKRHLSKNITTAEQLFAKADGIKVEGENGLANFLFSPTQ